MLRWIAEQNGRGCARAGLPMEWGNRYRKNTPRWHAFNMGYRSEMMPQ